MLIAVHRDQSGKARDLALSYAAAIGGARGRGDRNHVQGRDGNRPVRRANGALRRLRGTGQAGFHPLESYIADNPKFYPFFKGALGALDGTHISSRPPSSIRARYRNRKSGVSQNVLAATTFNMHFCYILSGWEGSASDGGSFMMHAFMTWSSQLQVLPCRWQAILSVMHLCAIPWCSVSPPGVGK